MNNVLIVGCGKIAGYYDELETLKEVNSYSHSAAYYLHSEFNIEGYVDRNIKKAEFLAEKFKCAYFSDDLKESLIRIKPAVVSVCTPDNSHYEVVLEILKSEYTPKIIFLEKPAFSSSEQFQHILALIKNKNIRIVVNQTRRFENYTNKLKGLIKEKRFGDIIRIDGWYYSGWMHNGVHFIDTITYLMNEKLSDAKVLRFDDSPYENDFNIDLILYSNESNIPVCINCFDEKYYQLFEFDLKFSNARIRIEDFGARILYEKAFVNEMNEDVLELSDTEKIFNSDGDQSPMYNAISRIHDYLYHKDDLSGIQLRDISSTMETIWKVQNLITNEFIK